MFNLSSTDSIINYAIKIKGKILITTCGEKLIFCQKYKF